MVFLEMRLFADAHFNGLKFLKNLEITMSNVWVNSKCNHPNPEIKINALKK